ncbi:GTPase [Photobacterium damselae subsp. damselae]|uniref:DUF3302 domain-containing protein n=1 Tax=Photobacterium damselae subsp. damselae TaxID=85581 RepID=A0A850QLV0_PHODD|nr:DUF3302 domain-containing protein [Photobacterium damselae]ELI6449375.1 DUF3302 domain-containing protein [Photobacterium damselae]NVH48719.1 DUF3302 domain-containing protein [Photobacterium damselae subsp. damselae]NVO99073.1 DUF3302 domain-containing protein [Photobacterium damselae subsp. damselae]PSB87505.1 GTPase [Photobacterium damselae subsp. damselae]
MFLDYFALGLLFFVALVLFYGIIVIHDIPYEIAKTRNHPHQDAIHYAGWVSLFTLHVLWPFLWIWATLWRDDRGWGFNKIQLEQNELHHELTHLTEQLEKLTEKVTAIELAQTQLESATKQKSSPEEKQ